MKRFQTKIQSNKHHRGCAQSCRVNEAHHPARDKAECGRPLSYSPSRPLPQKPALPLGAQLPHALSASIQEVLSEKDVINCPPDVSRLIERLMG